MAKTSSARKFKINDYIVYPAHGVGRISAVETQTVAEMELEVYVVQFDQDKMVLRVPVPRAESGGMRALSEPNIVQNAMKTLKGRPRIKRTMWSRRAQEYEAKINSGDLIFIAEVVRDLHRNADQPEQSYSERQLYESAIDRMAREVAAVEKIERDAAFDKLSKTLVAKAISAASAA
jgi:CarD family transcriptional regulator